MRRPVTSRPRCRLFAGVLAIAILFLFYTDIWSGFGNGIDYDTSIKVGHAQGSLHSDRFGIKEAQPQSDKVANAKVDDRVQVEAPPSNKRPNPQLNKGEKTYPGMIEDTVDTFLQSVKDLLPPGESLILPQCLFVPQTRARYEQLRSSTDRYVIALNLWGKDVESITMESYALPNWTRQVLRLAGWLGEGRVAVSVIGVERGVYSGAEELLRRFEKILSALSIPIHISTHLPSHLAPHTLLTAHTLQVPQSFPSQKTHLIFLSPTLFCLTDILELIKQHHMQDALHTCGMDYVFDPNTTVLGYKGAFVPRDVDGYRDMRGAEMFKGNDNWFRHFGEGDEETEDRFEEGRPFQ
ncbi:hypothetical protein HDV00_011918, partial [Rhizophlyctis rosea]